MTPVAAVTMEDGSGRARVRERGVSEQEERSTRERGGKWASGEGARGVGAALILPAAPVAAWPARWFGGDVRARSLAQWGRGKATGGWAGLAWASWLGWAEAQVVQGFLSLPSTSPFLFFNYQRRKMIYLGTLMI